MFQCKGLQKQKKAFYTHSIILPHVLRRFSLFNYSVSAANFEIIKTEYSRKANLDHGAVQCHTIKVSAQSLEYETNNVYTVTQS